MLKVFSCSQGEWYYGITVQEAPQRQAFYFKTNLLILNFRKQIWRQLCDDAHLLACVH